MVWIQKFAYFVWSISLGGPVSTPIRWWTSGGRQRIFQRWRNHESGAGQALQCVPLFFEGSIKDRHFDRRAVVWFRDHFCISESISIDLWMTCFHHQSAKADTRHAIEKLATSEPWLNKKANWFNKNWVCQYVYLYVLAIYIYYVVHVCQQLFIL